MFAHSLRRVVAAAFVACILTFVSHPAFAATATASLTGEVTSNGLAVAGVAVTVSGNRQVLHATTDARGQFSIASLPLGTYQVRAALNERSGALDIDLGSGGATITVNLSPL